MRFYRLGLPLLVATMLAACQSAPQKNVPPADIQVLKGPTWIQGGDANGSEDITIVTPYFAFAIAGGDKAGKAGSIVDMALVENGVFGADRIVSLDFVPGEEAMTLNAIDITQQTPERVVIEVDRSWNGHRLLSRYEVEKAYPGIKLSSQLENPVGKTLFAGYRLVQNAAPEAAEGAHKVLTQAVVGHWSQGQLQQGLGALSETDDLRRSYQPSQQHSFDAWLSAGSLGKVLADELVTGASPNTVISLYEYDDSSNFEAQMAKLRQRWNRGERVYLSANHLLRGPRQNSGRLYAYTPNGKFSADFASAVGRGHSFVSFGPQVYAAGTLFGEEISPFSESRVELRSEAGLSKAEVWLDGEQVAGWRINGAKVFRTGVPVPPNYTWLQWVVEDRNGNRAYSNPIWIKKRG
ncbi:CehA/McbA family metallohydrolase domain-containing protein [Zobellella maritima]|uniref:hypothetical protein n=1 Tax=Zobellella maritima TaxID=2059725 RepID=UPI000E303C92|nr:hypothetical protein [Zobellella maritima]